MTDFFNLLHFGNFYIYNYQLYFIYSIIKTVITMQWQRLESLIGIEKIEKLKQSTVMIIGLGGVGGYTVEALARSNIGTLILIDYDTIDITNLNRQIIALHSTLNQNKVDVWKQRINDINPSCNVIIKNQKLIKEDINELIDSKITYVVDACDTTEVKKELIRVCHQKQVPLITSTGTARKLDPSKLEIIEIQKTSYDPLAKILRKMVKEERIKGKVMVIASTEKKVSENQEHLGSAIFVPSVAGILCASYVVKKIMECVK